MTRTLDHSRSHITPARRATSMAAMVAWAVVLTGVAALVWAVASLVAAAI